MRNLEIGTPDWSVDDAGELVSDRTEKFESNDHVEAATVSYSYARI